MSSADGILLMESINPKIFKILAKRNNPKIKI